jgi:hypothetical protein
VIYYKGGLDWQNPNPVKKNPSVRFTDHLKYFIDENGAWIIRMV